MELLLLGALAVYAASGRKGALAGQVAALSPQRQLLAANLAANPTPTLREFHGQSAALVTGPSAVALAASGAEVSTPAETEYVGSVSDHGARLQEQGILQAANTAVTLAKAAANGGAGGAIAAVAGMVGTEIDKALGGDGKGARGIVASAGLGAAAALAWSGGPIVGVLATVAAAIAYIVTAGIEDENGRVYTLDGGPWREFETRRADALRAIRAQLLEMDPASGDRDVMRVAVPMADGFVFQQDRLGFLYGQGRPMGKSHYLALEAHTSHDWHVLWHLHRGYFVGMVLGVGTGRGTYSWANIPRHGRDAEHLAAYVPANERRWVKALRPEAQRQIRQLYLSNRVEDQKAVGRINMTPQQYVDVEVDVHEQVFFDMGRCLANAYAYSAWMSGSWGVGQTEASHAKWGFDKGHFEGALLSGKFRFIAARGDEEVYVSGDSARLRFIGPDVYWRAEDGNKGVFTKRRDA